jgi:tetratricopeptide (TPR) repeat protein
MYENAIKDYTYVIELDVFNRYVCLVLYCVITYFIYNNNNTSYCMIYRSHAYHNRGLSYERIGKQDAAVKDFQKVIEIDQSTGNGPSTATATATAVVTSPSVSSVDSQHLSQRHLQLELTSATDSSRGTTKQVLLGAPANNTSTSTSTSTVRKSLREPGRRGTIYHDITDSPSFTNPVTAQQLNPTGEIDDDDLSFASDSDIGML